MKQRQLLKRFFFIALAVVAVWSVGFGWFLRTIGRYDDVDAATKADGIVVLAGGAGRIAAGVDLLRSGRGNRLLISGVDPNIASDVIYATLGNGGTDIECCVDLGRAALDTAGNADEALAWARDLGFKSLLVVTADYHMPRSLAEFRCRGSEIRIYPQPVKTAWSFRTLAFEHAKYTMRLIIPCRYWGGK